MKLLNQDFDELSSAQTPHIHLCKSDYEGLFAQLNAMPSVPFTILEGSHMKHKKDAMLEFSSKLGWSDFNENWDAFWENILDMSYDKPEPHVLVIRDAHCLFELGEELKTLFTILKDASVQWAIPNDRKRSLGLNTILQVPDDASQIAMKDALSNEVGALYWNSLNKYYNN